MFIMVLSIENETSFQRKIFHDSILKMNGFRKITISLDRIPATGLKKI